MNKQKCFHCQLVNLASDLECRRCGRILGVRNSAPTVEVEKKKGSGLFPLAIIAFVLAIAGFIFWGVQRSYYQTQADDAARAKTQRGTQAFQADPGAVEAQPIPIANLQNVSAKPIVAPTLDMSKVKIPTGPAPGSDPAKPAPPKENPNTAKVQAIQNGLSKP